MYEQVYDILQETPHTPAQPSIPSSLQEVDRNKDNITNENDDQFEDWNGDAVSNILHIVGNRLFYL